MADSVEERIIANVVTTVQGVTTDNGYDFDVAVVQRQEEDIDQFAVAAGAIVVHDGTQAVARYISATIMDLHLAVVVGLKKPGPTWTSKLTNLMSQISQALMVDEGRGEFDSKANARRTDIGERFVGDHEVEGRGMIRGELGVSIRYGYDNDDETSSF